MFKKMLGLSMVMTLALTMFGCEYSTSTGIKKDFLTGLTVKEDGLRVDEVYLTLDGEKSTVSEFELGSQGVINFKGVDYWKVVDGKVFPGAAILVVDENNTTVMEEKDLFEQYKDAGVTLEQAKDITLSLTIGSPLKSGQNYTWKGRIWDRQTGKKIDVDMGLKVK